MRYDGTGAQKVSSWTAFYRMRFHEGWSVVVDCASLRPTAWMFDGASRIAWKYRRVVPPSFSLSLSLSLSLFSFSPSDITRDNVTRRSNKGTWRRDGRARGMDEVTDRLQGWGCAGPWFVFHGGGSSYRGFKSVALTFLEIHANLIRAHANLLGSNVRKVTPIDRRRRAGNMYFPSRIKTVRRASGASLLFTLTEFQSYFFYSLRSVYDRGKAISSVYRHPWLRHFIVVIMF